MSGVRDLFDILPLLVRSKLLPSIQHRPFIRPGKKVHKLGTFSGSRFPRAYNLEAIGLHDPSCVITETVVKRSLVALEDLVDSELMDHFSRGLLACPIIILAMDDDAYPLVEAY